MSELRELHDALKGFETLDSELAVVSSLGKVCSSLFDDEALVMLADRERLSSFRVWTAAEVGLVACEPARFDAGSVSTDVICVVAAHRALTARDLGLESEPDGEARFGGYQFAPLSASEQLIGLLGLSDRRRLEGEQLELFCALATAASLVLEQLHQKRRALEEEKGKARLVQLSERSKLDMLTRLVAGFAHELNNPVGAIQSAAVLAGPATERIRAALDRVGDPDDGALAAVRALTRTSKSTLEASRRISELVGRMKSYARLDEAEVQVVDLNVLIQTVVELTKHSAGNIDLRLDLAAIPAVKCAPRELTQAFSNLLDNGIRSIVKDGSITVATRAQDGAVVVRFTDTGCGIAAPDVERIFEPGFSGWDVGVGSGLGLAAARMVIERHKGKLSVASERGRGTTMTVALPI